MTFDDRQRRRQDRALDALCMALRTFPANVQLVGVTGIGYPRSFYRLHWKIGNVGPWLAAQEDVRPWPAPSREAAYRHPGVLGRDVTYVRGTPADIAGYDFMAGRVGLGEAMAVVRAIVALDGRVLLRHGWQQWVASAGLGGPAGREG